MHGTPDRRPTGSVRGLTCDGTRASLGLQLTLAIAIFSLLSTSCTPLESKPPGDVPRIEQLESALAAAQRDLARLESERSELQRRYEAALKERDELLAAQMALKTEFAQAEEARAAMAQSVQRLQGLYDGASAAERAAVQRVSQLQRDLQKAHEERDTGRASLEKARKEREAARALPPDFQVIDELIRALPVGIIAFSHPREMVVGESRDVDLLLSVTEAANELKTRLHGEAQDTAQLKASRPMRAEIKSDKFTITSLSPEEQLVGASASTEWRWEIKATTAGDHSLQLGLSATVTVDGQEKPKSIRTFDRVIKVRAKAVDRISNFLAKNWQWLAASLVIPLGLWAWYRRRRTTGG